MSLLDTGVPNIGRPAMIPSQYVSVPTQATVTETSGKMTSWYNWLVNHIPTSIKKNASSIFNTTKGRITSLYTSPTMVPTKYVKEPLHENIAKVDNKMTGWMDWLTNHIPKPIRRNVSSAFEAMKARIMALYEDKDKNYTEATPPPEQPAQQPPSFSEPVLQMETHRYGALMGKVIMTLPCF